MKRHRRTELFRWSSRAALVFAVGFALLGSVRPARAQAARLQGASGSSGGGATVSATWPSSTGAGHLLLAAISFSHGTQVTITPPAVGWTLARRHDKSATVGTALYYWEGAPAQSGASVWDLGTSADATLFLLEYEGLRAAGALDAQASGDGTGATVTVPSASTTQSDELAIALGVTHQGSVSFSGPTGGFAVVVSGTGGGQQSAFLAERFLSATGSVGTTVSASASAVSAAVLATFKVAAKYWNGTGWSDTSAAGASSTTPTASDTIVLEAGAAACTLSANLSVRAIDMRAGYSGTLTVAAGTTVALAGGLAQAAGTFQNDGGTLSVAGAAQIAGGTFQAGTGVSHFLGGLTVAAAGHVRLNAAAGHITVGSGQTLALAGALTASATTAPTIAAASGHFIFQAASTAIFDITALTLDGLSAAGLTVASGATYTRFRGLRFLNNAGGGASRHLAISATALDLFVPDAYFDGSAGVSVSLSGNGDADGGTRVTLEYRGAASHGAGAGEATDLDDDADNGGLGDGAGDHPTTDGAVVQWVRAAPTDTAGTISGFPTAAFDWNTFTWYATYAAYKNVSGAGTADRVYVRTADGAPAYSFDVAESAGDLVGTPHWDSVNESSAGVDANGDGDATDVAVHVLYLATSGGKIIKLVDSGTALVPPGPASPWTNGFSDSAVGAVTSPLASDGNNVYFGGADGLGLPRVFAVQIAGGVGEATLARNVLVASAIRAAPAVATIGGQTYLFAGSRTDTLGVAHLYRVAVAAGLIDADYVGATAHLNARVTVMNGRVHAADSAGRLHGVDAADFAAPYFQALSGFPFVDETNHATCGGVCGVGVPAYVDATSGRVYFGDDDGHVYAVTTTGALVAGYPIRPTTDATSAGALLRNGVLVLGTSGGRLLVIDESTGNVIRSYGFGAGAAISTVGYDNNRGQYLLATSAGNLLFVPAESDPTP